jgi:hypothetical protein
MHWQRRGPNKPPRGAWRRGLHDWASDLHPAAFNMRVNDGVGAEQTVIAETKAALRTTLTFLDLHGKAWRLPVHATRE